MPIYVFIWTEVNIAHLAEHDVTVEEAAYVVEHPKSHATNRKGEPIAFGYTRAQRHLAVCYWFVDDQHTTVYIETAYDTPPRRGK